MPRVEDIQVESTQSCVIAYGTMGEKGSVTERGADKVREREGKGTVKVGAYGESCQKHTDTRSCLQLPGPQSFNKLPAGILKLENALRLRCSCMHTRTNARAFIAEKVYSHTSMQTYTSAECKYMGVNLGLYQH